MVGQMVYPDVGKFIDVNKLKELELVLSVLALKIASAEKILKRCRNFGEGYQELQNKPPVMGKIRSLPAIITEEDLLLLKNDLLTIQSEVKQFRGIFGNKIKPVVANIDLVYGKSIQLRSKK